MSITKVYNGKSDLLPHSKRMGDCSTHGGPAPHIGVKHILMYFFNKTCFKCFLFLKIFVHVEFLSLIMLNTNPHSIAVVLIINITLYSCMQSHFIVTHLGQGPSNAALSLKLQNLQLMQLTSIMFYSIFFLVFIEVYNIF